MGEAGRELHHQSGLCRSISLRAYVHVPRYIAYIGSWYGREGRADVAGPGTLNTITSGQAAFKKTMVRNGGKLVLAKRTKDACLLHT